MTARKTGTLVRCLLIPVTIILAAMAISGCGGGGSSDSAAANQPPAVGAGLPQVVTLPFAASTVSADLDGTVTDDGLPNPPGAYTTIWSKVSPPGGTVTFGDPNAVDTTVSFSAKGTYVLRLTANDGGGVAFDEVTVTVGLANRPPAVDAGPDLAVTLPAAASLDGTVTDDGLPNPPGAVTTTWSQVSGSGTVTFADPSAVDTTASFSGPGTYVLRLSAGDGELVTNDTVTVTVGPALPPSTPNISLLPEQTDFGAVVLGKSADKSIEIMNTGNADLTIDPITGPANPFSIIPGSDNCSGAPISPSSSCGLTLRFAPTTQGDFPGSLDITSNDPDGTVTATLAGKGRALLVSINRVALVNPQTVQVTVSVGDQSDAPVTTLTEGNFSIVENGSPKIINSISNTMSTPLSVGMVLDYSGSMTAFLPDVKAASKSFVDLLEPVNDEAEVIKFSSVIETKQPFTQDKVALKAAIDAPFLETVGTFLYDALLTSINSTSLRSNPRLAIVAVSDGVEWGGEPTATISDVIAGAVFNNVQIFTIGIGEVDNVTMQQLATETGGQFFSDPTASDLATVYSTISEILSNEYTIEYTTSSAAGSTISLVVMVDDNGGLPGGLLGEYSITVDLF